MPQIICLRVIAYTITRVMFIKNDFLWVLFNWNYTDSSKVQPILFGDGFVSFFFQMNPRCDFQ